MGVEKSRWVAGTARTKNSTRSSATPHWPRIGEACSTKTTARCRVQPDSSSSTTASRNLCASHSGSPSASPSKRRRSTSVTCGCERDAPEEGPGDSGEKADFHGALKPYHNAAMRFIAHVDMDAFYASVELLRYPELRGKPLVIGGRHRAAQEPGAFPTLREYKGRGVITTATYEARAFGVNSGMALMRAAKKAPDALLLPADFDEYRRYSRMFKEAVRALAPETED